MREPPPPGAFEMMIKGAALQEAYEARRLDHRAACRELGYDMPEAPGRTVATIPVAEPVLVLPANDPPKEPG